MLLHLIWLGCLTLAVVSVAAMCGLILRRMVVERRARRRAARQRALRQMVFQYLEDPASVPDIAGRLDRSEVVLIRDTAEDLARMVRGTAHQRLAALIAELGGGRLFTDILSSGAEDERLRAVASLALFPDDEGERLLNRALRDSSPRVQLAAAHALVDLQREVSVRDLIDKLDIGDEVRSRGLRDLFRELAPRRTEEMLDLLNAEIPDAVKAVVLYGLAGLRDPRLLQPIMAMFDHPSVDIRAASLRALAAIGHPRAEPVVLSGLADESWVVRNQAAICAGAIGLPSAIPALSDLLVDDQWWVRFRAARALLRLGRAGRQALDNLAETPGPAQDMAKSVLAEEASG